MRWFVVIFVVAAICGTAGCKRGPAVEDRPQRASVKIDPNKPEDTLYAQIRAGSTQIEGVIDTLDAVLEQVKRIDAGKDPDVKAVFEDLKDAIDAAGAALASFAGEEPDRAAVAKNFAKFDEWRIGAIAAGNDARHELIDAQGLADNLVETAKIDQMAAVADLLEVGIVDLRDAIETLGGKVED
jgi:hypothetical protein